MKLFLDDIRECPDGWVPVKSVGEAQHMLKYQGGGRVTDLSLDHDLGDYVEDGGDAIKLVYWLAEELHANGVNYWPTNPPVIHSANPVGRDNMQSMIDRYGPYGQEQ